MTDDRDIVRAYSQDRQTYRHRRSFSTKTKPSTNINTTSENYYTNRNCPEMLSLFALSNKQLDHREKQTFRSSTNDRLNFHMINYQFQPPSTTTTTTNMISIPMDDDIKDKQPILPTLTPRSRNTPRTFPTLTSKPASSNQDKKAPMPTIRSSNNYVSSPRKNFSPTKMPTVSTEKKKKIQIRDR